MPIFYDLSEDDYFDGSHFGSHALRDFEKRGPGYFFHRHMGEGIAQGRRRAFDFGKAAHKLILEGEQVYQRLVVIKPETYVGEEEDKELRDRLKAAADARWKADCTAAKAAGQKPPLKRDYAVDRSAYTTQVEKPWRANAGVCAEWEARHERDNIITVADDRCLRAMQQAVRENADCMAYLRSGIPETTVRTMEQGLPIQMRADWIAGHGTAPWDWEAICDLKTCDSLTDFWLPVWLDANGNLRGGGDVVRYGYHRQAAFYQWLLQQETGFQLPFVLIAVEKAPPHRCGVYRLGDGLLERAHERNMWLVEQVAEHHAANVWPRGNPVGEQLCDLAEERQGVAA